MNQRKAFNFYRSYYDVLKELPLTDQLPFLMAILERQFDGKEPILFGQAKLAYISQKHNIDAQVLGFETKTGKKLTPPVGATEGATEGASVQGKGKGKGESTQANASEINFSGLVVFINESFGKNFRVINDKLKGKFKARLNEGYTKEDFFNAITNASNDKFHKENNFQYCTPEFFSRSNTLDKYGFKSSAKDDTRIIVPIDGN